MSIREYYQQTSNISSFKKIIFNDINSLIHYFSKNSFQYLECLVLESLDGVEIINVEKLESFIIRNIAFRSLKLKTIFIEPTTYNYEMLINISTLVSQSKELKTLSLQSLSFDKESFSFFEKVFFMNNEKLCQLDLKVNFELCLVNEYVPKILNWLISGFKNLKYLKLDGFYLNEIDKSLQTIKTLFKDLKKLKRFDLVNSNMLFNLKVNKEFLFFICEKLNLNMINLENCYLTNGEMQLIERKLNKKMDKKVIFNILNN